MADLPTADRSTNSGPLALAKSRRTRPVSGAQVRAYAAEEAVFAEAAASALDAGRNIAATSLAIHADMAGSPNCSNFRLGPWSLSRPAHRRAAARV